MATTWWSNYRPPNQEDSGIYAPRYTSGSDVWWRWTNERSTSSTAFTHQIWQTWNSTSTTAYALGSSGPALHHTLGYGGPAFQQHRQHRRAELDRRLERDHQQRVEQGQQARRTARQLLMSHLSAEQQESVERNGWFNVVAQSGRTYQIEVNKLQHNVFLLNGRGRRVLELCAHTTGVPLEDNAMAQKLYLEYDEQAFLTKANIWSIPDGHEVSHSGSPYHLPPERRRQAPRQQLAVAA